MLFRMIVQMNKNIASRHIHAAILPLLVAALHHHHDSVGAVEAKCRYRQYQELNARYAVHGRNFQSTRAIIEISRLNKINNHYYFCVIAFSCVVVDKT